MTEFRQAMEAVGVAVDAAGVLAVVVGVAIATARFAARAIRGVPGGAYRAYRQDVGRAILLGLELLVAGDIIRTVVVAPTLENVAILAGIVLIRTFLSVSLQLELDGRWPWQRPADPPPTPDPARAEG